MNKKIKQELEKINNEINYLNIKKETLEWVLNLEKNNLSINTTNIISIGEEITINHEIYEDIPFIVIGKNHDASNSVTLLTRDIVRLLPFDAVEFYNNDTNRKKHGNNRYIYSNLLQWMNSDEAAGEWYTSQHNADVAPSDTSVVSYNPYSNVDGLLRGFDNDVVNSMITVYKTTAVPNKNDRGDLDIGKVFLLSTTEVGLADKNNIDEGNIYEYFDNNNVDAQRLAYPSEYCLNNAGGFTNTSFASGKPWHWWLRTPYSGNSYSVRFVDTTGALNNSYAYYGYFGLRFAICLPTDKYLELKEKEN